MSTPETATIVTDDGWTTASASSPALKQAVADAAAPAAPAAPVQTPPAPPAAEATPAAPVVEGDKPAEAEAAQAKPKRNPVPRINELTGKWRNAEGELAAERTRTASLEQELATLRSAQSPAPTAPAPDPVKPAPDWDAYEADGKSWKEFEKDRTAWFNAEVDRRSTVAAERAAAKVQESIKAEQAKDAEDRKTQAKTAADAERQAKHKARIDKAREKYADLDELVAQNLEDVKSPFLFGLIQNTDEGGEILYHLASKPDEAHLLAQLDPSPAMAAAMTEHDHPLRFLSYFAQHPDEFSRINDLSPARALLALGRLDKQIEDASRGPSSTPAPPPMTRAAGPIRPVVQPPSTGPGARGSSPSDLEFGPEYIRRQNKIEADRKRQGL